METKCNSVYGNDQKSISESQTSWLVFNLLIYWFTPYNFGNLFQPLVRRTSHRVAFDAIHVHPNSKRRKENEFFAIIFGEYFSKSEKWIIDRFWLKPFYFYYQFAAYWSIQYIRRKRCCRDETAVRPLSSIQFRLLAIMYTKKVYPCCRAKCEWYLAYVCMFEWRPEVMFTHSEAAAWCIHLGV